MYKASKKSRRQSSARAGLIFPCGRFKRQLKEIIIGKKIRLLSAIYISAALEYLVAEVLDLAKDEAHQDRKKRIAPRHITQAVKLDDELSKLLEYVIIPEA